MPTSSTNSDALDLTISALPGLTDEDAALIAHARLLARLLDQFPTEVKLHSEYREVLRRLTAAGQAESVDEFAALIAALTEEEEAPRG